LEIEGFDITVACRAKRTQRRSAIRCDYQNDVDAEMYFKTITLIQSLKPSTNGGSDQPQRTATSTFPDITAAERQDNGETVEGDQITNTMVVILSFEHIYKVIVLVIVMAKLLVV